MPRKTRTLFNILRKASAGFFAAAIALAGVFSNVSVTPFAQAAMPPGFEVQTIASGLNLPTALDVAGDGRIFVAEKSGTVRLIKNGQLLPTPVVQLTDLNNYADRGLIGLAVDPNFSSNGYLYLSYTYENTPGANLTASKTARIVRLTVNGDTANEATKVVLVGTVGGNASAPSCENYPVTADCIASDSSAHSAGALRFGPDGKLYASTGDGARFDIADPMALRAQNLDSLSGKVLRINPNGTAPTDNPFYNGDPNANRSKVYAYGVRNMFRMSFRPSTGALYGGDVGWDTWEEINIITAGGNYGWPCREGNHPTSYNCTATGHINPVYSYIHQPTSGGSVTAGVFPATSVYPAQYHNQFIFGDFVHNTMKLLNMGTNDTFGGVSDFMLSSDNPSGPVDFAVGPDGYVYFIGIYTGEVKRINYTLGNRQPIAVINATPTSGALPLTVSFSSAGSSDPDGHPLSYLWNFGNGVTSTQANPSHTYTSSGTYTATLRVSDGNGGLDIKSITIYAGNRPPVPTITSPQNGSLYFPGDLINVSGSATDPEDGALSGSALSWRAILHHNTHTHILQTHNGPSFQFVAPDHGDPAVYTELELTATDSGGVTAKRSVNIYLNNGIQPGSNLIQNASLETIDPADTSRPYTWNKYRWGTNNPTYTYPVTGYAGVNMRGAQITMSGYVSGDAKWGFDPVHVGGNKSYKFQNHYKSNVTTRLVVAVGYQNGTTTYDQLAVLAPAANWTQAEATYVTPANAQTLAVYHLIDSNGTLSVDDFYLFDLSAGTQPPTGTNLVPNQSVETANGNVPQSWQNNKWGSNTAVFTYPVAGQDGTRAVKIDMSGYGSGDAKWFFNDVAVTPGTQYTFSNYYQSSIPTALVARYTSTTGSVTYHDLGAVPSAGSWTQLTRTFTIPSGTATMTMFHLIAGNGTLSVDNYFLSDGSTQPPSSTNLVANGFLENASTSNPNVPASWTAMTSNGVPATFTYPTTGVDNGKAARVTISGMAPGADGNARWQFAEVPIQTGVEYTYEGWYKGTTISDIIGRYTFADNTEHYFGLKKEIPAASGWTFVTGKFVGPVNVSSITLMHLISTNATLEIDNVKLYVSGTGTPNEIIPPTQSFTNPLDGQTVSGTITLTSDVQDNSGQAWLFYAVDGTPLGPEQPAPYSQQWDTTTVADGQHSLKVTARDAVGNNNRQIITVTVNNSATQPPTGTNLILNPSLETANGNQPANWLSNKWGTNTASFTYPVAGQEGTKAATIDMTAHSSGDAKWFFQDVAVTPGTQYTFRDYYRATVQTELVVRYTNGSGTASYAFLGTVPASATNWQTANATFTPPAGTVSATVFHIIKSVGTLTVDNYFLSNGSTQPPTATNLIVNGSFENASGSQPANWTSNFWGTISATFQYPITGFDGNKAARVNVTSYSNGDAKWMFDHVPVTSGSSYVFKDKYQSNVPTSLVAQFRRPDNTFLYQEIATIPASATWADFQTTITAPTNVQSVSLFHVIRAVGFLQVDEMSLVGQ